MKPAYEVADIIHQHGQAFIEKHPQTPRVLSTLEALSKCRTAALGGHTCQCSNCGHKRHFYNSCRNRHCPKCQAVNRERWIMQRESELLPVPYYHMVFTLPEELNPLAEKHPKEVYNALFYASWNTIRDFAGDHKFLGAKTGMVAILHTWGQKLWLHPHLHCIVPGGGITQTGKWKNAVYKDKYLFPKRALSKVYRAKFMARLRASGAEVPQPVAKALFQKNWVVYAKRPFATPKTVVEYLGRYTHKVAISNHRLKNIADGQVSFTYKDYRKGGRKLVTSLSAGEFLRRFCKHILPRGFVRMRHYGILASRNKPKELNLAKASLGQEAWQKQTITWEEIATSRLHIKPTQCPKCDRGIMEIIATILPERGPPLFVAKHKLTIPT